MINRRVLIAIAMVVSLPLFFALAGGSRVAGLAIGVVLVVAGLAVGLGSGRRGDGDGRG